MKEVPQKEYRTLKKLKKFLKESCDFKNDPRKAFVAAAALDHRGVIIAMKTNSYKTHPKMQEYSTISNYGVDHKVYLHAEVATLLKAQTEVDTLIITRMLRNGKLANAKPCPICQLAIKVAKVRRVFYTNEDGELILLEENI